MTVVIGTDGHIDHGKTSAWKTEPDAHPNVCADGPHRRFRLRTTYPCPDRPHRRFRLRTTYPCPDW